MKMIHSKIFALTGIMSFGSATQYHSHGNEYDNSSLPNIIRLRKTKNPWRISMMGML